MSDAAERAATQVLNAAQSASGYIREAAVRQLMAMPDDVAVPALAVRAADWVPEVRHLAREALRRCFGRDPEAVLLAAPTALALSRREQGAWLFDRTMILLARLDDTALRRALASEQVSVRRVALDLVAASGRVSTDTLVALAERDPDTRIRDRAAVAVFGRPAAEGDVRRFLRSRAAGLRAHAIAVLADAGDLDPARVGLLDKVSRVRSAARAALQKAGESPAPHYRRALTTGVALAVAILGLGETGSPDDASFAYPLLEHPTPRVRSAALRSLSVLGAADTGTLMRFLTDPAPGVVSCAARLLLPSARDLALDDLRALLDAAQPAPTRRAALLLLVARDRETRLLAALALTDDPLLGERARDDLRTFVDRDLPRAYLRLDPDQLDAARAHLAQNTHGLTGRGESALRSAIGLPPVDAREPEPEPKPNILLMTRIGEVLRRFDGRSNRR